MMLITTSEDSLVSAVARHNTSRLVSVSMIPIEIGVVKAGLGVAQEDWCTPWRPHQQGQVPLHCA